MKKELIAERQDKVLHNLYLLLKQLNPVTEWSEAEENGMVDMVLSEHNDMGENDESVLGEYYFLPAVDEEQIAGQFSVSVVLAGDLTPESAGRLYKALSRINAMLPAGVFLVSSDDKVLSYHRVISYPVSMEVQEMFDYLRPQIAACLQITSLWMSFLLYMEEGSLDEEDLDRAISEIQNQ